MFRAILFAATLIALLFIGANWVLEDSRLVSLAARWPEQAPAVDYAAGEILFTLDIYPKADQYFLYILRHYPSSAYAEESRLARIQCWRLGNLRSPAAILAECRAFVQENPNSAHAAEIRQFADTYEKSLFDRTETLPIMPRDGNRN
jgi:hypothetical protein